jgi:hypothetical protein
MRTGTDALISIRRLQGEDREPLEKILKATDMFTVAEVNVALELIDSFLTDPHQGDYFISTGVGEDGRVVGYYCIGPAPRTSRAPGSASSCCTRRRRRRG